jgi:hypothetical protein
MRHRPHQQVKLRTPVVGEMDPLPRIQIRLSCPAALALQRIAQATTKEGLPFLSPFDPREKPFLSRIDGIEFRIWKWPSRTGGRNQLVPILHAELTDIDGGSILSGTFRLHPFSRLLPWFMALVMLAISAMVWFQGRGSMGIRLCAVLFLVILVSCLLFAFRKRTAQLQAENQILKFLENVLADLR